MTPSTSANPHRIQRQRTKGWRMPPNTIYVGRPTKWGNPYRMADYPAWGPPVTALDLTSWFRDYAVAKSESEPSWMVPLQGRDLACWCPLDQPCHADVLLELANPQEEREQP